MKYALVTTTAYLILVDLESGHAIPLEANRQEYYGISWFAGDDRLVLSHSGIKNSDLKDLASYALSERGWISAGEEKSPVFLSQPHQILCTSDEKIVCTNTGRNVITTIELSKPGYYHECGVSSERWDRLSPDVLSGDHLNSVFIKDEKLYVVAHRFNKGAWLGVFSYPEMQLLDIENLGPRSALHNIWVTDEGQRISCDSEKGAVIDLDERIPVWISGSPIYTRGLAAHGNYIVVGESQKTGRDLRHSSMSGLWIIDRSAWKAIDHICFGPYGAVNEVRLLDVPDMAHHNIPFVGLGKLLDRKNLLKEFSRERLNTSIKSGENRSIWKKYELIFGSPTMQDDQYLHADVGDLSLIMKLKKDGHISYDYSFQDQENLEGRHVSTVVEYGGHGGDTHMSLLLIQPSSQSGSILSIWKNDGSSWGRFPEFEYTRLPVSGNMKVEAIDNEITIFINGTKLTSINYELISQYPRTGAFGIRWIGAAIKLALNA